MPIRALLAVAVVLTLFTIALGQTSRGTVTGTVTDPTGAVIAGADVILTSTATKLSRTTKTNTEGLYRFEAVDPGGYSVKVNATGFGEVVSTGIDVRANQPRIFTTPLAMQANYFKAKHRCAAAILIKQGSPNCRSQVVIQFLWHSRFPEFQLIASASQIGRASCRERV